jgi:hypothetical protein
VLVEVLMPVVRCQGKVVEFFPFPWIEEVGFRYENTVLISNKYVFREKK